MSDCLFCKIINKEVSSEIIFENDAVFAFKDIHPKAPIHLLVVPKKHIHSINDLNSENISVMQDVILAAPEISKKLNFSNGYKIAFNVGRDGGQVIDHIHMHILAWPNGLHSQTGKEVISV